jgi:hypothetical protein
MNKKKNNAYHIKYRKEHPEEVKIWNKKKHLKEKSKSPEKFLAWKNDYLKRKKECQVCKSKVNLEFHHTNYKKHEGITLCRRCHRNLHNITERRENTNGKH